MKKIAILMLLFGLLAGCGAPQAATALPEEMPADFVIRYMTWVDEDVPNIYDTGEGLIQKDLVTPDEPRTAQTELTVSDGTNQEIYAKVRACALDQLTDEKLTSGNLAPSGSGVMMEPLTEYEITFTADGETYTVTGDYTVTAYTGSNGRAAQFWDFVQYMNELFYNSPEYPSLPEAQGGYD